MTSTTKRCKECKENLPLDLFNTLRGKPRGKCRECQNSLMREYAKKRRQKAFERSQAQSGNNPPKTRPQPRKRPKKARRTRIRAMSREKQTWTTLYHAKCNQDTLFGAVYDLGWDGDKPVVIRRVGSRVGYERHHGLGRVKYRILFYAYVSPELHRLAHDEGKRAREIGLLLPEFDGRESKEGQEDPLNLLPDYWKYLDNLGLR